MILAGDIGGTKTLLALFERDAGGLRQLREQRFASGEYPSLDAMVREFLQQGPVGAPEAACFAVAGPVQDGKAAITNLSWQVDAESLAAVTGAPRVELLNDLQAAAYGMLWLAPAELATLQAGRPSASGNIAVIAPGTGLGEAMLMRYGDRMLPIASEGGHGDFAPSTEGEIELLRFLRCEVGEHVSYERILSGDGFHRLYRFLRDSGHAPEPAWLRERLTGGDPNAAITEIGLAGEHPLCVGALELFCSILGAEAGNLALRSVATGGIYIGGGIAPKILSALKAGGFLAAFAAKGRFSEWMARIPVRVALNPDAALIGAAHYGVR